MHTPDPKFLLFRERQIYHVPFVAKVQVVLPVSAHSMAEAEEAAEDYISEAEKLMPEGYIEGSIEIESDIVRIGPDNED